MPPTRSMAVGYFAVGVLLFYPMQGTKVDTWQSGSEWVSLPGLQGPNQTCIRLEPMHLSIHPSPTHPSIRSSIHSSVPHT